MQHLTHRVRASSCPWTGLLVIGRSPRPQGTMARVPPLILGPRSTAVIRYGAETVLQGAPATQAQSHPGSLTFLYSTSRVTMQHQTTRVSELTGTAEMIRTGGIASCADSCDASLRNAGSSLIAAGLGISFGCGAIRTRAETRCNAAPAVYRQPSSHLTSCHRGTHHPRPVRAEQVSVRRDAEVASQVDAREALGVAQIVAAGRTMQAALR